MTTTECILLVITIYLCCFYILRKKPFPVFYLLAAIALFTLAGTVSDISTRTTSELIVFNTPGSSAVGIRNGKIISIYSDSITKGDEINRYCATLGLKTKIFPLEKRYNCIRAARKKILITKSLDNDILSSFRPDYIIITGTRPFMESNLYPGISPEAIIISPGVSPAFYTRQESLNSIIDRIHIVRQSGAYIRRL